MNGPAREAHGNLKDTEITLNTNLGRGSFQDMGHDKRLVVKFPIRVGNR